MSEIEVEVPVYCYWNGCIKYGTEGVYYEGTTPKKIIVNPKIAFNRLLDEMYVLAGVDIDKQRSKVKIFGRYPSLIPPQSMFQYLLLPVVNSQSLETMLEVPSKHPSIQNVELYLEVIDDHRSLKRRRTDDDVAVKLERDDDDMTSNNSDQVINLTGDKDSDSGVSEPCLSGLWIEHHDLRVGLCFGDVDELKKAVNWCSIKGMQKCVVRETGTTDEFMSECIRWNCKWSLVAAKMAKHGHFEIVKYTGPHTCRPVEPENFGTEFEADEIERLVRVHPTMSFSELSEWWLKKVGHGLENKAAKEEAIKRVFGDWDQSFEDLPKLMSALRSSNGLVMDWKYDLFPNPKFASFSAVFWAFPQSIQGFQHCRPLMVVDTKELKGKYQLKLMVASGLDAANKFLPLAFAVTKEVSSDTWRWFLTNIREKVTQRKGLCLISSHHQDILTVVNEPESQWQEPWAYHRFCLKQFWSQFCVDFPAYIGLKSLLWRAGLTSQREKFENCIETIKKENPEARRKLDQTPQSRWAMVHDGGRRYGIMEIDTAALFSECRFFELAADHVVTGSVLLLFDELRDSFNQHSISSRFSLNRGDVYTKPVADKLEEFRKSSVAYAVMPLENNAFQVTATPSENGKRIVQLSDCTCTCGNYQRFKFPCLHALAVCKKLKINPLQYVDDCYTCERYYKTYTATFSPVPELSAWPEDSGVPRLFPPVIPPPPPTPAPPAPYVAYMAQRKTTPKTGNKKS